MGHPRIPGLFFGPRLVAQIAYRAYRWAGWPAAAWVAPRAAGWAVRVLRATGLDSFRRRR